MGDIAGADGSAAFEWFDSIKEFLHFGGASFFHRDKRDCFVDGRGGSMDFGLGDGARDAGLIVDELDENLAGFDPFTFEKIDGFDDAGNERGNAGGVRIGFDPSGGLHGFHPGRGAGCGVDEGKFASRCGVDRRSDGGDMNREGGSKRLAGGPGEQPQCEDDHERGEADTGEQPLWRLLNRVVCCRA